MKIARSWFALSLPSLFLFLLTGACTAQSSPSTESKADIASPSLASNQRPLAADFSVNTGGDSTFSLSDHRGEIVVLYFSFPG